MSLRDELLGDCRCDDMGFGSAPAPWNARDIAQTYNCRRLPNGAWTLGDASIQVRFDNSEIYSDAGGKPSTAEAAALLNRGTTVRVIDGVAPAFDGTVKLIQVVVPVGTPLFTTSAVAAGDNSSDMTMWIRENSIRAPAVAPAPPAAPSSSGGGVAALFGVALATAVAWKLGSKRKSSE